MHILIMYMQDYMGPPWQQKIYSSVARSHKCCLASVSNRFLQNIVHREDVSTQQIRKMKKKTLGIVNFYFLAPD